MRAFVRVLPLLVVAAHVAACATNDVGKGDSGGLHFAAAAKSAPSAGINAARERPSQTLLVRQPSPQCERSKPIEGVPADQARVAALDYEQQCYRQLVDLEHARLAALQDAAAKMRSIGAAQPALLERQPPPHCEPAQPAAGLKPAEAREAKLAAQRECYKQLEASQRQKIADLQDAMRKSGTPARSPRGHAHRAQRYLTY